MKDLSLPQLLDIRGELRDATHHVREEDRADVEQLYRLVVRQPTTWMKRRMQQVFEQLHSETQALLIRQAPIFIAWLDPDNEQENG